MTTVKVFLYKPLKVSTMMSAVILDVPERETALSIEEARELVKALKKHIKKAEGK